jgi:hypothetical protein
MNLKSCLSIGIIYFLTIPFINGQTLKKVSRNPYPDFNEQYFVLKDNPSIKEGPYKLSINGVVYQLGSYKNNQKSGVWQIYKSKNVIDFKYDYDTKKLIFLSKDNYLNSSDSTTRGPIYLGGLTFLLYSVANKIEIPDELREKMPSGQYRAVIRFLVDSLGNTRDYEVQTSSRNVQFDFVAISAVMQSTNSGFSFLSAIDKGKPTNVPMMLPVNFSIVK